MKVGVAHLMMIQTFHHSYSHTHTPHTKQKRFVAKYMYRTFFESVRQLVHRNS